MRPDQRAATVAGAAMTAATGAGLWGFFAAPELGLRWVIGATVVPALWAFVEFGQVRGRDDAAGRAIMTFHRYTMAWAGVLLAFQMGLRAAIASDLLASTWLSTGRRVTGLILGIGFVLMGNAMPTLRSPWNFDQEPFAWQRVHRFAGWILVLGGVVISGCWAVLPVEEAMAATRRILLLCALLAIGRKVASLQFNSLRNPL